MRVAIIDVRAMFMLCARFQSCRHRKTKSSKHHRQTSFSKHADKLIEHTRVVERQMMLPGKTFWAISTNQHTIQCYYIIRRHRRVRARALYSKTFCGLYRYVVLCMLDGSRSSTKAHHIIGYSYVYTMWGDGGKHLRTICSLDQLLDDETLWRVRDRRLMSLK